MSTDSETDPPAGTTITLTRGENHWIAKDEATGIVSQGESRQDALANLDEGTLREIADQAGAKDYQAFKAWIDRNR
jgi:hypothetical protein